MVNPSQQVPRTLEAYLEAVITSTNASVVQVRVKEATGRVENSRIFHPDSSCLNPPSPPGSTQIVAVCVHGEVLWELFLQSRGGIFFSQWAHNKPSAELVGALWWEGPLTLARDPPARQQVVITEGWVSIVPCTEAHVLCPVFPASNYLPALRSVFPVLVVFFVL